MFSSCGALSSLPTNFKLPSLQTGIGLYVNATAYERMF
jgi:hypothetical protein